MQPDRDLDRELRDLGPRIEYPPVPDLARSVRGRLEAEAGGPESSARSRPQLWWIAAAAVLLLAAVPAVSLAIRDTGDAFSAGGGAAGGGVMKEDPKGADDVAEQRVAPSSTNAESGASAASGSSAAACASPEPILETRPPRGAPGEKFSIRGRYFVAGFSSCDEIGSGSPAAQTAPARDVRVVLLQGGKTWELGNVVADKGSRIAAELVVPEGVRPGSATVRATYGRGPPESPYGRTLAEARFFVTG